MTCAKCGKPTDADDVDPCVCPVMFRHRLPVIERFVYQWSWEVQWRGVWIIGFACALLCATPAHGECRCDHAPGAKCAPGDVVTCDYADLVAIRDELADVTGVAEVATAAKNRAEIERDACRATAKVVEAEWRIPGWALGVAVALGLVGGLLVAR